MDGTNRTMVGRRTDDVRPTKPVRRTAVVYLVLSTALPKSTLCVFSKIRRVFFRKYGMFFKNMVCFWKKRVCFFLSFFTSFSRRQVGRGRVRRPVIMMTLQLSYDVLSIHATIYYTRYTGILVYGILVYCTNTLPVYIYSSTTTTYDYIITSYLSQYPVYSTILLDLADDRQLRRRCWDYCNKTFILRLF